MKKFIAYFDYLGFKYFIERNDIEFQRRIVRNNFRDIEQAMSNGKTLRTERGHAISDLSDIKINCVNFSDNVIFWTNDNDFESFKELIKVSFYFNQNNILRFFPSRGSIIFDELEHIDFRHKYNAKINFILSPFYGSGLIKAYRKTECQDWAGCVIDDSVIKEISKTNDVEKLFLDYAIKYKVPYKSCISAVEKEYALRLFGPLNEETFTSLSFDIRRNFSAYNKPVEDNNVNIKLNNTIQFLQSLIE